MRKLVLLFSGMILVLISFLLNYFTMTRLFLLVIGIIIIDIYFTVKYPKKILLLLSLPIIFLGLTYGLDILLVKYFNRVPIYSYEIKSSEKVSVYNSFFYRTFNCNGKLIMDYGYTSNYVCSPDDLNTLDVNALLSDADNYNHKFVKITGKISKVSGINVLELAGYNIDENNKLNGYVTFKKDLVKVNTNEDLSRYHIYDEVVVIGLINKITNDENITIDLTNTLIIPSDIYDTYDLEIILDKENGLTSYIEKNNLYLLDIKDIYIHYDNNHIYELKYLINDNRLNIDDLLINKESKELLDQEEKEYGRIYELDKFNVLKCNNDKTILMNQKSKVNNDLCMTDNN